MPIYIFLYFRIVVSGWGGVFDTLKACCMIKIADTNIENNQRVKYMSVDSSHPKTGGQKCRNMITLKMNEILECVQNNYSAVNSQYQYFLSLFSVKGIHLNVIKSRKFVGILRESQRPHNIFAEGNKK
jgi:hypothetical protein